MKITTSSCRPRSMDDFPRIFVCVTMWHESHEEMTKILESLMRMDVDQCSRKTIQDTLGFRNPNYYELEAHIFLDDAFIENYEGKMMINDFVRDLIAAVDNAASKVYKKCEKLEPPIKVPTPYGGRLVWRMPGDNALVVHLKNKELIRHKKRWSQVMYMHYILCHRLENRSNHEEFGNILRNTFFMILDADVYFRPNDVLLLVDLVNSTRHKNIAAASGRLYPVGPGAIVNYQKVEFANGFWLSRPTELIIGCDSIASGDFSLFRAEALLESDIIRIYATECREAIDLVQYDQGEDRWLSTLLLQKGYRLEFSSESKYCNHVPNTLATFYAQRRRWISTKCINLVDLLVNYKAAVKCNDNLSPSFFAFLGLYFIVFVLSPGYGFLLLTRATNYVFAISIWKSFLANLVLIVLYILISFNTKIDTQVIVSKLFSFLYAFLMVAVFVERLKLLMAYEIYSIYLIDGLLATINTLIAALVYPGDISCLLHSMMYFLTLPSMDMLLILHTYINFHVVSWGTREVQANNVTKTNKESRNSCSKDYLKSSKKEELTYYSQFDHDYWLHDKVLEKSPLKHLQTTEDHFWEELLKKYLHPIVKTSQETAEMSKKLVTLRNKVAFAVLALNFLFVLSVLFAEMQFETLYSEQEIIQERANITHVAKLNGFQCELFQHILLFPLVFKIFPILITVINFVGMILFRYRTLSHTLTCIIGKKFMNSESFKFAKLVSYLQRQNLKYEGINETEFSVQRYSKEPMPEVLDDADGERSLPQQKGSLSQAFQKNIQQILKNDLRFDAIVPEKNISSHANGVGSSLGDNIQRHKLMKTKERCLFFQPEDENDTQSLPSIRSYLPEISQKKQK